jgi:hypothetical protein
MMYLSMYDLLYTADWRKQLQRWCERTPLRGDAAEMLKLLHDARTKTRTLQNGETTDDG